MRQDWIEYWYNEAINRSKRSKDANTKVGAVIVSEEDNVEISSGWNCLPRSVRHTEERNSRPLKYLLTSHSEISAITNAALMGRSTKGMAIFVTLFPCSQCAAALINSGIKKVYAPESDFTHEQYGESFKWSLQMFKEAKVRVEYVRKESGSY